MVRFFRRISLAEGCSLLILLFVAMPLKYLMDMPGAVKVVGWVHGLLFIVYVVLLVWLQIAKRWTLLFFFAAFVASLVPFGTFVLDKYLQEKESDPLA